MLQRDQKKFQTVIDKYDARKKALIEMIGASKADQARQGHLHLIPNSYRILIFKFNRATSRRAQSRKVATRKCGPRAKPQRRGSLADED